MRGIPSDWVTPEDELYSVVRLMPGTTPLASAGGAHVAANRVAMSSHQAEIRWIAQQSVLREAEHVVIVFGRRNDVTDEKYGCDRQYPGHRAFRLPTRR